ncbi:unnamed protein product [Symbiodinium pilosum]|uniref:C3H1-type domain-containing protein n=1 Tax=Symbiodinium pilosum TaxID=2952 RepID=A0A812JNM4_SYMPI|nr:unnamed protein product [Symbiodinium pilosum]
MDDVQLVHEEISNGDKAEPVGKLPGLEDSPARVDVQKLSTGFAQDPDLSNAAQVDEPLKLKFPLKDSTEEVNEQQEELSPPTQPDKEDDSSEYAWPEALHQPPQPPALDGFSAPWPIMPPPMAWPWMPPYPGLPMPPLWMPPGFSAKPNGPVGAYHGRRAPEQQRQSSLVCRHFLSGTCCRKNCRFSHVEDPYADPRRIEIAGLTSFLQDELPTTADSAFSQKEEDDRVEALDADTDNAASSGLVQEEDTVCSVSRYFTGLTPVAVYGISDFS